MKNLKKTLQSWYVSYNPYSDKFQMYDDVVFTTPKNERNVHINNNIKIVFSKNNTKPLLIEVTRAYDTFHKDIDKLDKTDIIDLVEPYFYNYGH